MASGTSRKIFLNLAVKDLKRSVDFFTALGFTFNPQFTDASATCMIVSDEAFVMLLVESRFRDFTKKPIVNSHTHTEAIAAGGSPANEPQDHGFMYGHSFQDPDGHIWEVIWMDPNGMPA
jgi:predicted lactoylglutathione lyase